MLPPKGLHRVPMRGWIAPATWPSSQPAHRGFVHHHDGWVQAYAPIVRTDEVSYIDIQYGNHSNDHKSYRLAGKWEMNVARIFVVGPDAVVAEITPTVFDTGEPVEVHPEGVKGYYTARFIPTVAGIYEVSGLANVAKNRDELVARTAKTYVAAVLPPLPEEAAKLDYKPLPRTDRVEIIPLINPTTLGPGAPVRLKLADAGQPLKGKEVSVIRRSTSEFRTFTTDAEGVIQFPAGPPDYYLVRSVVSQPNRNHPGTVTFEATLTYIVQQTAAQPGCGGYSPLDPGLRSSSLALPRRGL